MRAAVWTMAKQVSTTKVVVAPLRYLTRNERLPLRWRSALHRRIGKRIRLTGSFEAEIGGRRLTMDHDGLAGYYFWLGAYEPETTAVIGSIDPAVQLIVDVGARDGVFTMEAAVAHPAARVLAFEPDPAAFAVLVGNVERNRSLLGDRVEVFDVALSDAEGTARFYLAGGNSSLNEEFRPGSPAIDVAVRRGDDVLDAAAPGVAIGLLKVDTESFEPQVLAGLSARIARDRPAILLEVLTGRTEPALERFLVDQDYRPYWIGPSGPEAVLDVRGDATYRHPNFLFLPNGPRVHQDPSR